VSTEKWGERRWRLFSTAPFPIHEFRYLSITVLDARKAIVPLRYEVNGPATQDKPRIRTESTRLFGSDFFFNSKKAGSQQDTRRGQQNEVSSDPIIPERPRTIMRPCLIATFRETIYSLSSSMPTGNSENLRSAKTGIHCPERIPCEKRRLLCRTVFCFA